jgi:hypothetical protein
MARRLDVGMRDVDFRPKCIPVDFPQQILPGNVEHSLHALIDDEPDFSPFVSALETDLPGAPAYQPGVLLEIVPFAYSRDIISVSVRPSHLDRVVADTDDGVHLTPRWTPWHKPEAGHGGGTARN